jgi:energy-coupling factor transporter transmembrane protein EcfT
MDKSLIDKKYNKNNEKRIQLNILLKLLILLLLCIQFNFIHYFITYICIQKYI